MIKKTSMIVLIFLTIFLISSVSAAEIENETIQTKNTPQENIQIETHDVEMYYKDGTRFTADIRDENENPLVNTTVSFNINNIIYTRQSDDEGRASIALNLASGKYGITTAVNELSQNNTITIKSTISAADVVKIYRNSTQYCAKFLDKNGNNLINTPVSFNINGVFYTRTTDENGIANLNINLAQGKYILTAINPQNQEKISNTITVLPTITENDDIIKYYKNGTNYRVKILGKDGKSIGYGYNVEFNINGVIYHRQTNNLGAASLNINLIPGDYIITASFDGCKVSNNIKVLPTLKAEDINMEYKDGTRFKAYLVDGKGRANAYEKISFNINGVFYTRTTDENGVASLNINLPPGDYIITSQHDGLSIANNIKIHPESKKEPVKNTTFTYEIKIPNYVNVTFPYVFSNSIYSIKDGINGIIRMEKNQLLEFKVGEKYYTYSTSYMPEYGAKYLGGEYQLLPFDNGEVQHSYKLEKLTGNGLIIYRSLNYTHIIYRNNCTSNIEQFGAYIDKSIDNSEIINYIQNGENTAKINFRTVGFDEYGLKYTLSKYYGKTIYDFDYKSYDEITKGNKDKIKFVKTNESVTFDYFGKKIVGYISEEDIIAIFNSKNCIEFEKSDLITYGLSDKYKNDFDILHSFAIINEKVNEAKMNYWIDKERDYKSDVGMQSIYTMFLISLNTAYLSDKASDNLTQNTNIKWFRTDNTVILGSMNWKDTYLHILTPDMGREITGDNESDIIKFRFVSSILLSKIEQYSLNPIAEDSEVNITSAYDDIFNSLASHEVSIVYYNNTAIITDKSGNSSFIIDLKTGLVTPLSIKEDFAYKGVTVTRDCGLCSINSMLNNVMKDINNAIGDLKGLYSYISNNIQPLTSLLFKGSMLTKGIIGAIIGGGLSVGLSLIGTASSIQALGVYFCDNYVGDKDLHTAYDLVTFTRPGYLQDTKIYNIPKEDGSTDYIEIPINKDNSLNRENVKYISNGNVKTLTKEETYDYFTEEYWDPFSVPRKYWR